MFRFLHKSLLNRVEVDVIQFLLKKLSAFDSHRVISRLPDFVLASFLIVEQPNPEKLAKFAEITQVILDFCARVTFEIANNVGDLCLLPVTYDGVNVVGHQNVAMYA